ncbi:MAG TPA: diacylglycerol kinase family protein [Anaerolineae bacterium]|nr:diacylglycerol kinase family protein [Anaerolineae bacterium]
MNDQEPNIIIYFQYAFNGIKYALITQKNLRIHFLITIFIFVFGIYLNLLPIEWCVLILSIVFVIISEIINTALEIIVDMISKEKNGLAKNAKDLCAAAVLIPTFASVLIGIFIFLPKLVAKAQILIQ